MSKSKRQMSLSLLLKATSMVGLLLGAVSSTAAQTPGLREHLRLSDSVVDTDRRVSLIGAAPLMAQQAIDDGKLSPSEQLSGMKLVLRRGDSESADLVQFLADVQDPSSANYHHWLAPEEFGQRFGASDADISTITAWLSANGLHLDSVSKSHTVLTFSGTEAQFESAFRAEMHHYNLAGERRIANSSVPSVPTALAPAIVGLATLGNAVFRPQHTAPRLASLDGSGHWTAPNMLSSGNAATPKTSGAIAPQFTATVNGSNLELLGPADFGQVYGVKQLWNSGVTGTGQSIAIVAESNVATADTDSFRKLFGLPATKLNVIVLGADPGLDSTGSEGEADLDVQWAGAIAPGATINLLVAGSTSTQTGILTAAEYGIDNNLSPVMDVSWGACELSLGTSGNQYFHDLWAQAAAQGITVLVSSGDAGSVGCDQNQYYANYGQQVNGIASTEYATAVGGTDFYGNVEGLSKYWTQTNDPITLQSVKSYVTESTWNNSCVNPLILLNASGFGLTETTTADICRNEFAFLNTVGGGGGVSQCTTSDGASQSSCTGGYPAPAWQQSISSIGAAGHRHLPDVSFFAGSGLWDSAYAFCEADASTTAVCVNSGAINVLAAGGTSFGAPAFAGVVALLNQQQGSRQGNINKYLYALAAKQSADPVLNANCQSGSSADSSSCVFHDVVTGSITEPCLVNTIVDPSTGAPCTGLDATSSYGATPGYAATVGYDSATGLGSLNVTLLASKWASVVALDGASKTTHSVTGASSVPYGTVVGVTINVQAVSGTHTAAGGVSMLSTETGGATLALAGGVLSSGSASVNFNSLVPGTHQLYAAYGGDASLGASSSVPTTFTVTMAATALKVTASAVTVQAPKTTTFIAVVQAASSALNPTGTVVFTNQTTGKVVGSGILTPQTDSASGNSWAVATLNIDGSALIGGSNTITASYAGDANYSSAVIQSVVITYQPFYTVISTAASFDMNVSTTNQASTTVTVTAASGGKVDPSVLSISCQGLAIAGASCQFSGWTQNINGSVSSILTLTANNPKLAANHEPNQPMPNPWAKGTTTMAIVFAWTLLLRRRKSLRKALVCCVVGSLLSGVLLLSGCGGVPKNNTASVSTAVNNVVTVSSNAVSYGTSVNLLSTLTPVANSASPTGVVLFYDGATPIASVPASGGKASLTLTTLAVGTHAISASYSGDSVFMPSTSLTSAVSVSLAATLNIRVIDTGGNAASLNLPVLFH